MTNTTVRQAEDTTTTGAVLMFAMELSAKKWKLAFSDGRRQRPRIATIDAWDFDALTKQLERARIALKLPEGTPMRSCYEAGREGFSVHRRLTQLGIVNDVIDAASVDVSRRARRAKTDRLDVEMLVAKLAAHLRGERAFSVARVPPVEDEDARHEQRELGDLKVERGRQRVRIQSLLLTQGIRVEWQSKMAEQLATMRTVDGRALSSNLVQRIRDNDALLVKVQEQITRIEQARKERLKVEEPAPRVALVKLLSNLRGIGNTGAFRLVLECFAWRKFKTRREVAGCLGLAPSPFASGNLDREQGISKLGNAGLRALLIELSWLWIRYQPDSQISHWYAERFAAGVGRNRRVGIVAVARRLAIALWKFIEFGVVPEGAVMKT